MILNVECVFLGLETHTSKTGVTFNLLRVLTRPDNDNLNLFIKNTERFKDFKEYQKFNILLKIYKDSKTNNYKMGVIE